MIQTEVVIASVIRAVLTAGPVCAQQVNVEQIVAQKVQPILPKGAGGGVAVAVRVNGNTQFFNYGFANNARNERVTADSIFNLGSVGKLFATTSLAEAVKQDQLSLDSPVAKYVTELQRGGDIRRVTLGQLASHTSGLPRVPQQYETWHRGNYTWPDFIRFLNSWKAGPNHEPGQQYLYSNAAMVLLRVALERRFNTRFAALMHDRITGPLGMSSTALPLPRDLLGRAVQGYNPMGRPIGRPGEEQGTFKWPGAGQIYSSSRDMATFRSGEYGRTSRSSSDGKCHGARPAARVQCERAPKARPRLAERQRRQPQDPRQKRGTEQHLDLYRVRPAAEDRRRYSR